MPAPLDLASEKTAPPEQTSGLQSQYVALMHGGGASPEAPSNPNIVSPDGASLTIPPLNYGEGAAVSPTVTAAPEATVAQPAATASTAEVATTQPATYTAAAPEATATSTAAGTTAATAPAEATAPASASTAAPAGPPPTSWEVTAGQENGGAESMSSRFWASLWSIPISPAADSSSSSSGTSSQPAGSDSQSSSSTSAPQQVTMQNLFSPNNQFQTSGDTAYDPPGSTPANANSFL